MASEIELKSHYKAGYYRLLQEVDRVRRENPNAYDEIAKVARNYREWVMDMADLDKLPEVPPK